MRTKLMVALIFALAIAAVVAGIAQGHDGHPVASLLWGCGGRCG
jgi:hypothetical protein